MVRNPSGSATPPLPPPVARRRPTLLPRPSILIAAAAWIAVHAVLIALSGDHLPFGAASLSDGPPLSAVVRADSMLLEASVLMIIVFLITRRRSVPDMAARAPTRSVSRTELILVLSYGALALAGGFFLGRGFGWHAFSFHLDNMVIQTDQSVVPAEALCWAAYNLIAYAVVPLVIFRRRYSPEQLNLRSNNRRADLLLIMVILIIESTVQLSVSSPTILDLSPKQILIGTPLTFALSLAGTVLPTMVFIYCILTPRFLRLTGSVSTTVILGGVTYALLHIFDGWTNFDSPVDAVMSILFLLLFYIGPGMVKTFLTVRTGNAWVHVWAYHAIAPHTLLDTPMMADVFGIK